MLPLATTAEVNEGRDSTPDVYEDPTAPLQRDSIMEFVHDRRMLLQALLEQRTLLVRQMRQSVA
jgi:hypothetical protein